MLRGLYDFRGQSRSISLPTLSFSSVIQDWCIREMQSASRSVSQSVSQQTHITYPLRGHRVGCLGYSREYTDQPLPSWGSQSSGETETEGEQETDK